MRSGTRDAPSIDELLCLNSWPEDTVGFHSENTLIMQIKKLCDTHGYGRMHQLLEEVNAIWRDPDMVEKYKKHRQQRLKMFEEAKKHESAT